MAFPTFNFGQKGLFPFVKTFQWLRNAYGVYDTNAVKPPVDYSFDNAFPLFGDSANGTTAIHALQLTDANNVTQLRNPYGTHANALEVLALAIPATPTIANKGTTGATTYTYIVVAKSGVGRSFGSVASAGGTTNLGNATLSATNYNVVSWVPVSNAASYDIYKSVGGTTGKIATLVQTIDAKGLQNGLATSANPTYLTVNDTGLVGDGTTAPTINTSGTFQAAVYGDLNVTALTTPVNVAGTATGGTGTNWAYKIVARSLNGTTAASASTGNISGGATLSATVFNVLTWNAVPGAVSYDIYRVTASGTPSTTGKIANVTSLNTTYTDIGAAGDSTTAPTVNTTGVIFTGGGSVGGGALVGVSPVTTYSNAGANTIAAASLINGLITMATGHTGQTDTTDTAANIVGAIPNCQVGSTFEFTVFNGSGGTVTIGLGTGVTTAAGFTSLFTTATGNAHWFICRVTNTGTAAITIYSAGQAAY